MNTNCSNALLSYEQVKAVRGLVKAMRTTPRAALQEYGYCCVEDIPQADFPKIVSGFAKQLGNSSR